jgi:hypothetical protein
MWLPIEGFSRWGLYPEFWIKPTEYAGLMTLVLILFATGLTLTYLFNRPGGSTAAATA